MTDDDLTKSPIGARSVNGGSRPVPDPTELTDRAIARLEKSMTEYIDGQLGVRDERLNGIDEATKLRLSSIIEIPKEIDEKVGRLKDVVNEKFASIANQFAERDTRSERESRDNKVAVDAAFAAQKEAAAKQDEGNQKAIDKSELATAEKINKLGELFTSRTDAIDSKVDDVKERVAALATLVNGVIQRSGGATENRVESRQAMTASSGMMFGIIGALVGIAGIALALARFLGP